MPKAFRKYDHGFRQEAVDLLLLSHLAEPLPDYA